MQHNVSTDERDLPDSDCRFDHRSFLWRHGVAGLEVLATEIKKKHHFYFSKEL